MTREEEDELDIRPTPEDETQAAAEEAGAIGGDTGDAGVPPAEQPLREAGQGESEGFELAEEALEGQASHADPAISPTNDAFAPEGESDGATHGEPDTERGEDL